MLVSEALVLFGSGVQRIAVLKNKEITGILSQSKVLKWVSEDTTRLGDLELQKAENLGTPWSNVIKISKNALTIDAVDLMHKHGVFSLPLIDEDGKLVDHLSMSDFKHVILEDENFSDLLIPLEQFVKKRLVTNNQVERHMVTTTSDATFRDIVLILAKEFHVHQIYLLDSNQNPTSFVSMTDVCHKIFKHMELPKLKNKASLAFSRGASLTAFNARGSRYKTTNILGTSL